MSPPAYTLDQANRALPLIRAIASDVHEGYLEMRTKLAVLGRSVDLSEIVDESDLPEEVRELLGRIRGLGIELRELGVTLEDPELGLVSFRGVLDGREVNLCWKLGEDCVRFWYGLGQRYEDRRPLSSA